MPFTDNNGLVAWTWDHGTGALTMDSSMGMALFDSIRPLAASTQADLTPDAVVNTLYGPGQVNP